MICMCMVWKCSRSDWEELGTEYSDSWKKLNMLSLQESTAENMLQIKANFPQFPQGLFLSEILQIH